MIQVRKLRLSPTLQVLLLICIRMLSMNCHVTPAELM